MATRSGCEIRRNNFAAVTARITGAASRAVREVTLDLLSEAVKEAPVKEGILRGSGTAHFGGERIATGAQYDREATGSAGITGGAGTDETTGLVAFNTVYAIAQHERTDFNHPKGGKAKYLEDPLERNRQQYLKHIQDAVDREIRK